MPFQSLHTVLDDVQQAYQTRGKSQVNQLMQHWAIAVGPVVAAQTKPLNLYRGVLKVATSSAVWAQTLMFERQRILANLQEISDLTIKDIHFSPGDWATTPPPQAPGEVFQQELWQSHPSRLPSGSGNAVPRSSSNATPQRLRFRGAVVPSPLPTPAPPALTPPALTPPADPQTAQIAFQQWAATMKLRSRQLPLCPECQCPAPSGELQRWSVCGICASKRWAHGGTVATTPAIAPTPQPAPQPNCKERPRKHP